MRAAELTPGKYKLIRIVSMLTKLIESSHHPRSFEREYEHEHEYEYAT